MDGEGIFFVLEAKAIGREDAMGDYSFLYSLVEIPADKIERAVWMQDGIDSMQEKLSELREQREHFGGAIRGEISKLETKLDSMLKERNDYLGKNAISHAQVIEKGVQTFFEGDGVPASAFEKMVQEGVLCVAQKNLTRIASH